MSTNTERLFIMAHKNNFLSVRKLLGEHIREIDYPTKEDPAYLIRAEVPVTMVSSIRGALDSILGR